MSEIEINKFDLEFSPIRVIQEVKKNFGADFQSVNPCVGLLLIHLL